MSDIFLPGGGVISVGHEWKPGDQPPKGYTDWHEWAEVQYKAGLRQKRCDKCSRFRFPQEVHHATKNLMHTAAGQEVWVDGCVCNECNHRVDREASNE